MRVLANAAELIEVLAPEEPLTAAVIAQRMDIPRSNAYRLLDGLAAISLVSPLGDGRVRLSSRWLHLADAARQGMHEWDDASPVLDRLVERTGQTAFLSVLADDAAFCIDWVQGPGIDILATRPGRSLPLNAGASGRVMLAFSNRSGELLSTTHFTALTATTLVDPDVLRADVELTRAQGFVFSDEDAAAGITGIAVPVFDDGHELAGTVSIAGLTPSFHGRAEELTAVLIDETSSLQGRPRGYRPGRRR